MRSLGKFAGIRRRRPYAIFRYLVFVTDRLERINGAVGAAYWHGDRHALWDDGRRLD
jgi:hypothetical protein